VRNLQVGVEFVELIQTDQSKLTQHLVCRVAIWHAECHHRGDTGSFGEYADDAASDVFGHTHDDRTLRTCWWEQVQQHAVESVPTIGVDPAGPRTIRLKTVEPASVQPPTIGLARTVSARCEV